MTLLRIFLKQGYSRTGYKEAKIVQRVMDRAMLVAPPTSQFVTPLQAVTNQNYAEFFEKHTGQPFTPHNLRKYNFDLLNHTDALVIIRTGDSESIATDLAYNYLCGNKAPVFFAIHSDSPIESPSLLGLGDVIPTTYCTFSEETDLDEPLKGFFEGVLEYHHTTKNHHQKHTHNIHKVNATVRDKPEHHN